MERELFVNATLPPKYGPFRLSSPPPYAYNHTRRDHISPADGSPFPLWCAARVLCVHGVPRFTKVGGSARRKGRVREPLIHRVDADAMALYATLAHDVVCGVGSAGTSTPTQLTPVGLRFAGAHPAGTGAQEVRAVCESWHHRLGRLSWRGLQGDLHAIVAALATNVTGLALNITTRDIPKFLLARSG